jgi:DNA sulfur modification protein DndE
MIIENIRLSAKARDQLITLKRRTGIVNWNVLCRWALCLSLAERSKPPKSKIIGDSQVEMSWKTFGGAYADVYDGLFRLRSIQDGIDIADSRELGEYFRLHLHRGISYLVGLPDSKDIRGLLGLAKAKGK